MNILGVKCSLLSLRSKAPQRATILLLTHIYSCRLNFHSIDDNFHITNCRFFSSNIQSSPVWWFHLKTCQLKQAYIMERLKWLFRKFYCRYGDSIIQYEISIQQMLKEILRLDQIQRLPPPMALREFMTFIPYSTSHRITRVSVEHLRRVWHANMERSLHHLRGSVSFWDLHML